MPRLPIRAAVLAALIVLPALAVAQPLTGGVPTVFRAVPVGQPALAVDVWGGVAQPGRYLVAPGATLVDVLGLAGGPAVGGDDLAAQTVTVTLTRGAAEARRVEARLALSALADGASSPALADGDLVVVRTVGAGRVSVPVDVWGAVGQPGRFEVAPGSNLVDVLTLAGGPALSATGGRVAQTAVVSLSRATPGGRAVVFEGTLEALAARAAPAVEPGDLVTVRLDERQRVGWRDALQVTTGVASLALVIFRLVEFTR